MRQSHLILSNAIIIWASRVLLLVPQFVLVPYLIRTIGEAGYGVYALVWSLILSVSRLEASLQSGVVKYSAGFLAQGRIDDVNKVVSSSSVYSILLAILACATTLAAAAFYQDPSGQIGSALVVVSIMVLFIVPLTPYIAIIQSRQRYYVGAVAETISRYVSLGVLVVWFHTAGPSVKAPIIIMTGMLFLSRLAQVPVAYRMVPGLRNRPSLFDGASFRLIAAFGAATVLIAACLALNSTGVRWLMDSLASTRFVAHLAIMLMPIMLLSDIIGAITVPVMPATSAYDATGNRQMLRELLIRGMRYTTLMAVAALLVAALLMRNALSIWVGAEYAFLAPYALVLFASGAFMQTTSTAHHMLKGMGCLRSVVLIYWIGLVIVPIGTILALHGTGCDPYLAVTAGLAAGYVVCGGLHIACSTKAVHAPLRAILLRAYCQPLVLAGAVYLPACILLHYGGLETVVARGAVSAMAVLCFFAAGYFRILSDTEREEIHALVRTMVNRLDPRREARRPPEGPLIAETLSANTHGIPTRHARPPRETRRAS